MRFVSCWIAATVAALSASAPPAAAQEQALHPESVLCTGAGPETSIDRRIAACNTILNSGRFEEAGLPFLYYQRALRYVEKGDLVRALADLNESIRRKPEDADALFARGNLYYQQGDLLHALEDYNATIRLSPAGALPRAYRGDLYAKQNDLARAFDDYDAAIQLDANQFNAYIGRGSLYAGQKDYVRAIADFDQAIRIDPNNASGYSARGDARQFSGDYAHAIEDYTRLIRIQPVNALAYNARGYSYANDPAHNYVRAFADYDAALRIDPKYQQAINNRASAYDAAGDRTRGLADWRRLGALDPHSLDALNGTCRDMALLALDLAQARSACDAALAIRRDANVLDSRGMVGLKQGRFQDAWNDYDAAAHIDPARATYAYGRGIAALRLGHAAEGQADLARAAQLEPGIAATYAGYGINP